ncbi:hypothetical protein HYU94_01810 [Candidatus Daviesbacteria bacterium]|nr:hypothetical protein [Candidatus Daviesbacteria bacterium]
MGIDKEPIMVFRPHGQIKVIDSPEELAKSGIGIHPDIIKQNWGPDAVDRYRQAKFEMNGAITFKS